jgi:hypothetical protein
MSVEHLSKRRDFLLFEEQMQKAGSPSGEVLIAHLFSETLLDRIITKRLPGGAKFLEKGKPNYAQKLLLAEALNNLSDDVAQSLTQLNKVRNQLAHNFGRDVTHNDIQHIGSPLAMFGQLKAQIKPADTRTELGIALAAACAALSAFASAAEEGLPLGSVKIANPKLRI